MTYALDVASSRRGDAQELYRFDGPQVSYTYTSGTRSHTFALDGLVYAPLAGLKRTGRGSSSSADKTTVTVTFSGNCDLATDYAYGTPPASLRLRIYELQRYSLGYQLVWDGDVVACSAKGVLVEMRSTSQLAERMASPVPSVSFQSLCNHFLYDARCTMDRATVGHNHAALVSSISVSGFTVTVDSIGLFFDDWFRAGEIVRDSDGERRLIVGQVGAVLTIAAPFRELAATDAVTLYAGCDHRIATCSDKFNNVANYGGHPAMPNSNPFIVNIRLMKE